MYTFHLDDKHVAHISDPTKIGPNFGARYIVKTIITGWYKKNYNKNLNITKELKEKGPFSNLQHTALAAGFGVEKSADDFNYFLEFETLEEGIAFYKEFSFIDLDEYFIFEINDEDSFRSLKWLKDNDIEKYSFNIFLGASCVFLTEEPDALAYKLIFYGEND